MLKEQLQKEIKEQAEAIYDKVDELAREQDSYDFGLPMFYKETCPIEKGLTSYASLWQAAEEKAARYENALKEISEIHRSVSGAYKMQAIANYALTPKTGEDEK